MAEISDELVDRLASIAVAIQGFVALVKSPGLSLASTVETRIADRVSRGVCLQCQTVLANETRVTRGLCKSCYTKSMQRIRRNQTTEHDLIENGYILAEVGKGGRKSRRADPVGDMIAGRSPKIIPVPHLDAEAETAAEVAEVIEHATDQKRPSGRKAKK